jgi:hypothetical protein
VTEEVEEIHRNIQDVDNLFRAGDKDEILVLAVKARHVRDTLPSKVTFCCFSSESD